MKMDVDPVSITFGGSTDKSADMLDGAAGGSFTMFEEVDVKHALATDSLQPLDVRMEVLKILSIPKRVILL